MCNNREMTITDQTQSLCGKNSCPHNNLRGYWRCCQVRAGTACMIVGFERSNRWWWWYAANVLSGHKYNNLTLFPTLAVFLCISPASSTRPLSCAIDIIIGRTLRRGLKGSCAAALPAARHLKPSAPDKFTTLPDLYTTPGTASHTSTTRARLAIDSAITSSLDAENSSASLPRKVVVVMMLRFVVSSVTASCYRWAAHSADGACAA